MISALALIALVVGQGVQAGATPPTGKSFETRHLVLRIALSSRAVPPGARVSLLLDVTPKPGMHVYAPEQRDVIPISLALDRYDGVKAHPPRFPKSEKYFFAALNETQFVYSKPFRIVQDLTVLPAKPAHDRAAGPGSITVSGKVRYQACDDKVCFMPEEIPVSWTIDLAPARAVTR